MAVIPYDKLVRDRIPEILAQVGKECVTETLSDDYYLVMLDSKLDEELADLLEVLRACALARGYTLEELEEERAAKAAARGGFSQKLLLRAVIEKV